MAPENGSAPDKAQEILISTLCKISDLDPMLGGKWKRGMLRYYAQRLGEVMLVQSGHPEPTSEDIEEMALRILDLLDAGYLGGP